MKKAPKRIIALLLSVILALGMLPISTIAGGPIDWDWLQNQYNQLGKSGVPAVSYIDFAGDMLAFSDYSSSIRMYSWSFYNYGQALGRWSDWDVSNPENPILRKNVDLASFAMFPFQARWGHFFVEGTNISYYENNTVIYGDYFNGWTWNSPQNTMKLVAEKNGTSKATIEVSANVTAPKADELTALRTLSINIDGKSYYPDMVEANVDGSEFLVTFGDNLPEFSMEKFKSATISYTLNRSDNTPVYYSDKDVTNVIAAFNSIPLSSSTYLYVGAPSTEAGKFREYRIYFGDSDYGYSDNYAVKDVSITGNRELPVGKRLSLRARFTPSGAANKNVTWTSSDTAVATVASDGTVTGIAPGTAIITVKTEEGGFTDSVVVTVRAANTFTDNTGTGGGGSDSSYDDNNYDSSSNPVASTANATTTKWITPTNSGNPTRQSGITGVKASVLSKQNGKYSHDTTDGKAVQVRLTIPNPSLVKKDLLVSAYVKGSRVDNTVSSFGKWFSNEIKAINFDQQSEWGQPVEVAAKIDLKGMDTDNLVFYSYNKANNTYKRIPTPKYWIDNNGYLRFTTEFAGDIVVSDGVLVKK